MSDLKTIGKASALFKALGQIDDTSDRSKTIEQRARFYKLHPLLRFPDDWEDLSDNEKEKRLDKLDTVALDKEEKRLDKLDTIALDKEVK